MTSSDQIEWDEDKRAINIAKHGIDFAAIKDFDWDSAFTLEDDRADYGERRFVSIAPAGGRVLVAVWTGREHAVRLISLRKANDREVKRYDENQG